LELKHSNLWQSSILSNHGFRYYVGFVDDFSRYTWIYPLRSKSDFLPTFCALQKLVKNLFDTKLKIFQSDSEHEFDNTSLGAHF